MNTTKKQSSFATLGGKPKKKIEKGKATVLRLMLSLKCHTFFT